MNINLQIISFSLHEFYFYMKDSRKFSRNLYRKKPHTGAKDNYRNKSNHTPRE